MSPNPVDLDSALSELRSERPSGALRPRLLRSFQRSPRRPRTPWIVTSIALVAATAFLWPHRENGIAWARSQAQTAAATRCHQISTDAKGHVTSEQWRDGTRMAEYILNQDGKPWMETRTDGKRRFWYLRMPNEPRRANGEAHGTVSSVRKPVEYPGSNPVDRLLHSKYVKVTSQEKIETSEGDQVKYSIQTLETRFEHRDDTVFSDLQTGLIRRIVFGNGLETRFEYPSSIPSEVFKPEPQIAKGVKLYDVDKIWPAVQRQMKGGMGSDKGVTLRLVAIDGDGALWVLWTGHLPDGRLSHPIRIPGLRAGQPFAPRRLTSSFKGSKQVSTLVISGQRLGGMSVVPEVPVGERLEKLVIPTPSGEAVFRNVSVLRISSIADYGLY